MYVCSMFFLVYKFLWSLIQATKPVLMLSHQTLRSLATVQKHFVPLHPQTPWHPIHATKSIPDICFSQCG